METSLPTRAYQHIRARLVSGEFGPGARLDYKRIGSEMGISTTPVREAMGKLASEGFVDLVPRLGAVIRRMQPEEAIELYEVRECMEPFAAARAAEHISAAQLEELGRLVETMRTLALKFRESGDTAMSKPMLNEFHAADFGFHKLILRAAGNRRLEKVMADCHALTRIFAADRHELNLTHVANTYGFHRRIYRALVKRDGPAAAIIMRGHIRHGLHLTLNANARQRWSDDDLI